MFVDDEIFYHNNDKHFRILLGLLGQLKVINVVILLAWTYGLTGVGMICAAVFPTFWGCVICAAMFGFFYAATGPVYMEVCEFLY